MKRALIVLAFAVAAGANAQTVDWNRWDPMAVRSDRTATLTLELQTSGPSPQCAWTTRTADRSR